jgi:flagellar motor switch/type III secretory pathway protein FliN
MIREQKEYTNESMERRTRAYEIREQEELEHLADMQKTNWLLFKQPLNQAGYLRLNTTKKQKIKKGAYIAESFNPLVVELGEASTTIHRLMQLNKKGCVLVCYKIDNAVKATAVNDQRISDVLAYLDSQNGKTLEEIKEASASAEKTRKEFEEAKQKKGIANEQK